MIRFLLADGSIVEAVKDCGCLPEIHEGPHWLHMSDLFREIYEERFRRGGFDPNTVRDELERLRERHQEMVQRGIVKILRGAE